ncbi:cation-translocating P-type ATPase [Pedobacter sp. MC2016-14]|uniref:cation-translocating P-type ATPase n=1 Tax=Pedobacter sp. MC2016-14 TaxID=2897327 RepID=UPI001E4A4BCD|nr:cation-translocating P-type ATPase [Pedobacter sp. MC2016-14]MCD0487827.1 cation-translocating P-type ATPase [Pedobacter sp. MC2016-14]
MKKNNYNLKGLSTAEVTESRKNNGSNIIVYKNENATLRLISALLKEPMVILLLAASSIYLISGKTGDGLFLLGAVLLISTISLYQSARSKNALKKLKLLTNPKCKVIRNGNTGQISTAEIVVGDYIIAEEGILIPADGIIFQANDFSVNEAVLTGESLPVFKDETSKNNFVYTGTTVTSGLAIARVTSIGIKTKLGEIGRSIDTIPEEKTQLEKQMNNFVKSMVYVGLAFFIVVWGINYYRSQNFPDSLIKALTLAISILPEEIPVAFTTFMALGAWRLMKTGIIFKQMKTVETLGSATVICTDKTGTLTENNMTLAKLYVPSLNRITSAKSPLFDKKEKELINLAMWASEPIPFDPMEVALHEAYANIAVKDERPFYQMAHEYPLSGMPPMMTHIFKNESGNYIAAAKGAPEALLNASTLKKSERQKIEKMIEQIASDGYRLLGVGQSNITDDKFPEHQQELSFTFIGLVAFYDPPKENITAVLQDFYAAGIEVKIVTGDNAATTMAIANQIGFKSNQQLDGEAVMKLSDTELKGRCMEVNLFTRMFPEAKLKLINALKANHQVVAMTGDGINDGPALKAAHIGIAMGKKGTEIAKNAASLILIADDLSKMTDAIAAGRKIYGNLKKAIRYIISIHIPIILTVFIPLILGWIYPNIFSPVHVIFLELIMGPTCSIIYENEPMEENSMLQKPRPLSTTFFNWKELSVSIVQGLMITAGMIFIYRYAVGHGFNEYTTRSMVFTSLISANVFLTLVNRSFYYSILSTLRYQNNLILWIISITITLTGLLLYAKPITIFFEFESLHFSNLMISVFTGFLSVIWFELLKFYLHLKNKTK